MRCRNFKQPGKLKYTNAALTFFLSSSLLRYSSSLPLFSTLGGKRKNFPSFRRKSNEQHVLVSFSSLAFFFYLDRNANFSPSREKEREPKKRYIFVSLRSNKTVSFGLISHFTDPLHYAVRRESENSSYTQHLLQGVSSVRVIPQQVRIRAR